MTKGIVVVKHAQLTDSFKKNHWQHNNLVEWVYGNVPKNNDKTC